MKTKGFILSLVLFAVTNTFAQTAENSVTGVVKEVKPHFAGAQTLIVNNTELDLIADPKDATGNTFEINKEYKDLLIKKGNAFILNTKYQGKSFKFIYTVNGKGWKCISSASEVKVKKNGISDQNPAKSSK
ncbi:MAG: hypothetical protein ACXVC6_05240 [Bacteroidia bacterium]